jgi:hypothetical protein
VDIYDGDDDYNNEPIIYHGKTLTTKVPLRDICQAIKKYGFTASPYPIIISAEVHCGLEQQEKLVIIMKEVFGGDLVQAPIEGRPPIRELPSPEVLKGKFLLKVCVLTLWMEGILKVRIWRRRRIWLWWPRRRRINWRPKKSLKQPNLHPHPILRQTKKTIMRMAPRRRGV